MAFGRRCRIRSQVRKVVGSICNLVSFAGCQPDRSAYLVQLVEITKDDGVIPQLWEDLFAHCPSSFLLLFPIRLPAL